MQRTSMHSSRGCPTIRPQPAAAPLLACAPRFRWHHAALSVRGAACTQSLWQRRSITSCQSTSREPGGQAGRSKGTKLRASRPKEGGSSSSGGGGGPSSEGNNRQLLMLAGHATYTGLVGTLAVCAAAATHVNLMAMFHWDNTQHLVLAVALMVPLQVANLLLLGPDWSSWKLPEPLQKLEGDEDDAVGQGRAAASGTAATTDTSTGAVEDSAPAAPAQVAPGGGQEGIVRADAWGMPGPGHEAAAARSGWLPSAGTLRDASFLAQGHYVANNPSGGVTYAAQLLVAVVDSLANEMLFRGLMVGGAAGWARQQLAVGGWPDQVWVPAPLAELITACAHLGSAPAVVVAVGGTPVELDDVVRWATGAALVALLGLLAARRVGRATRKAATMADLRARISSVRRSQRAARDAAAAKAAAAAAEASKAGAEATTPSAPVPRCGPSQPARPALDPPMSPIAVAATGSAMQAIVWATGLQASRDLLQGATLTMLFVATGGNLAACVTASLLNEAVFSALQRVGDARLRQRSLALAKRLEGINARLQDVAAKQARLRAAISGAAAPPAPGIEGDVPKAAPGLEAPQTSAAQPAAAPDVQAKEQRLGASNQQPERVARAPDSRIGQTLSALDLLVPDQQQGQAGNHGQGTKG